MMDPNYITAFIGTIQNVFSTMLQLEVQTGDPSVKSPGAPARDVSGIIGMTGDVEGSVVLSFDLSTAEGVVSIFSGEAADSASDDFSDAVGELVNMVSGGAKAAFPDGHTVSISCPSVVVGAGHKVNRPSDIPCIQIPCSCDCGEFVIEVAIRQSAEGAAKAAAAATA